MITSFVASNTQRVFCFPISVINVYMFYALLESDSNDSGGLFPFIFYCLLEMCLRKTPGLWNFQLSGFCCLCFHGGVERVFCTMHLP